MEREALVSVKEHVRRLRARLDELARRNEAEIAKLLAVDGALPDVWVGRDGARLFSRRLDRMDQVVVETFYATCDAGWDDPASVYATPCTMVGGSCVRYAKDYLVGTRIRAQLFPNDDWEQEMRRDGVPEAAIAHGRTALSNVVAKGTAISATPTPPAPPAA